LIAQNGCQSIAVKCHIVHGQERNGTEFILVHHIYDFAIDLRLFIVVQNGRKMRQTRQRRGSRDLPQGLNFIERGMVQGEWRPQGIGIVGWFIVGARE
jgi:hypothetical protein